MGVWQCIGRGVSWPRCRLIRPSAPHTAKLAELQGDFEKVADSRAPFHDLLHFGFLEEMGAQNLDFIL